jgi:excisionase family DNA binding protein
MTARHSEILRRVHNGEALLPSEVAHLFRVDPKTVTRWCNAGKMYSFKTFGGHRRIPASVVLANLKEMTGPA